MAIGSITTTATTLLGRYYDKLLIEREKPQLRMMQFAQMRPCPANSGVSVYFTGYRPLAKPSSALSDQEAPPTSVRFGSRQISATVAEWGLTARMSRLLSMTKIDPGFEEQVAIVADNASRTLDYQLQKLLAKQGVWGLPVGIRTSSIQTVTVSDGGGVSGTTSGFYTTAATAFNTATSNIVSWVGAYATVISDAPTASGGAIKYGWAGRVTEVVSLPTTGDYVAVSGTAPCVIAPEAFAAGDKIRLVATSSAFASNVGSTHFALCQRDLIMNKAVPFAGGYFAAGIPADILYSLKTDSTWVNAASYSGISDLYRGEVGRWYGCRIFEMTEPYRETALGVEAEGTGYISHSFFMGKNAFGHTELEGGQQKLYVTNGVPDSYEPIPRNSYVSWYHVYAQKALVAPWCVDLLAHPES